jgi:tetratricopeptide (TPR) repeat protein
MSDRSPCDAYLVEARACASDPEALRDSCRRALAECPTELRTLVDIGILLCDVGLYLEADDVFTHILRHDPASAFGFYERAVSRLLRGLHIDALLDVESLLASHPRDTRALLMAARLLQSLGDKDRANRYLWAVSQENAELAQTYLEFGEYIDMFTRGVAVHLAAKAESQSNYLNTGGVIGSVSQAIADQRGFSMVRLGDGEGAYMIMSPEEERKFSRLYRVNRSDRANVWFAG